MHAHTHTQPRIPCRCSPGNSTQAGECSPLQLLPREVLERVLDAAVPLSAPSLQLELSPWLPRVVPPGPAAGALVWALEADGLPGGPMGLFEVLAVLQQQALQQQQQQQQQPELPAAAHPAAGLQ